MLDLLLTARDGGTAWRHHLASGEARAGWECVGPLGLAKRLAPPEPSEGFAEAHEVRATADGAFEVSARPDLVA